MLTSRPPAAARSSWTAAHWAAAMMLSLATSTAAFAGNLADLNCVGGARSFNCVAQWGPAGDPMIRTVPEAVSEAEKTRATAQDRKWLTRCRPVVEHDRYGVARYRYSAPGCEFGIGAE